MLCNVVYARLAAGCADNESRQKLDEELYAPAGGWEPAERNLWANMAALAGKG